VNSIRVNILGRSYPLRVLEGEEKLMESIATFVDSRFKLFKNELVNQPEQTIMVLASLSIAEELFALQRKKGGAENGGLTIEESEEISRKILQLLDEIKD
jgi:cell division protein ZapA